MKAMLREQSRRNRVPRTLTMRCVSIVLIAISATKSTGFMLGPTAKYDCKMKSNYSGPRYNFFKDMIEGAFENDRNLSPDKTKGQYDAPGEEFEDPSAQNTALTETQRKWRESQTVGNDVIPEMLNRAKIRLELYLSGVPEKDPSNDLYGSKVNISSRDKETGLSLPSEPSATLDIQLLENGVCRSPKSAFTSGSKDGEWRLSDDGKVLRFSLDTLGYTRTVETKGTIQKIYWSDEDEKTTQTSSSYSIPPGFVYGDIEVIAGRQPGTFSLGGNGVLRVEKSTGLFGVSSKMVSCGKFTARLDETG